jgi:hypothetical protein
VGLSHVTGTIDDADIAFEVRVLSIANMDIVDRVPIDAERAFEDDV